MARLLPALLLVLIIAAAALLRPDPETPAPPDTPPQEIDDLEPGEPAPPPPGDECLRLIRDRHADAERRLDAIAAVAAEDHFDLLRAVLFDPAEDPAVRMQILRRFGRLPGRRALDALLEFHSSFADFSGPHILVKALGDREEPEARALLAGLLRRATRAGTRAHAAEALGRPGVSPEARRALRDAALSDPSENVRLAALRGLIRAGDEEPFLRTLLELPQASPRLKALADRALSGG